MCHLKGRKAEILGEGRFPPCPYLATPLTNCWPTFLQHVCDILLVVITDHIIKNISVVLHPKLKIQIKRYTVNCLKLCTVYTVKYNS